MASGLIHSKVTKTLIIPSTAIGYLLTDDFYLGLLVGFGCWLGLFIEPDLDISLKTDSESRLDFIPIFGKLWFWLWKPYGNYLNHRSYVSHLPILSTLVRYIYLTIFLVPLLSLMSVAIFGEVIWIGDFVQNNSTKISMVIFGNIISDYGHFCLDLKFIKLRNGKFKIL